MTTARLTYSRDEILTDPGYATRIERNDVLLHGGYASDGSYLKAFVCGCNNTIVENDNDSVVVSDDDVNTSVGAGAQEE